MRALAIIKQYYKKLDAIGKVLQVNVFVNSTSESEFVQYSEVADAASEILYEVLDLDVGRYTRTAIGAIWLPKKLQSKLTLYLHWHKLKLRYSNH